VRQLYTIVAIITGVCSSTACRLGYEIVDGADVSVADTYVDAGASDTGDSEVRMDAAFSEDAASFDATSPPDASERDDASGLDSATIDASDALWDAGPQCGDGVVDVLSEDCDDSNPLAGDGCSSTCAFEDQGNGSATCAAPPVLEFVPINATQFGAYATGATFGMGNDLAGSCALPGGPDVVYEIHIDQASDLVFQVEPTTNSPVVTYLRGGVFPCTDSMGDVACTMRTPLTATVAPGTYYFIIDSYPYEYEYRLTVIMSPN
jgi:cysteine-rich repeat protein